ncbi:MAG: SDR family oxidoreductase [Melioribacteraceae bacterium]|nr:SDR family oxidoreductase [Melioribacteraceae bacterium]MCF8354030.1 SDR family oxidoreductase [Melioribacteraceae bacterium]MCF8392289.1 SDR family oxidoreductase [Melioribacteraceae bacterium]MCF8417621.1 SDR family oxidoreductase [Melioribacteraceae bacterium]
MKKILLAGATGYLGRFILAELERKGYNTRAIVRDKKKLNNYNPELTEVISAEVTKPESLTNICAGIDVVISTVGITKQKDGLSYEAVDYQANVNLLNEALKKNVRKFIYISVLKGDLMRDLVICSAKEKFVDELKSSGIDYTVIRPNGFFSDITEFYNMAVKGRIYLFGKGEKKLNPIHGEDLAEVCVDAVEQDNKEINIGGPEVLSQNEIAEIAFAAARNKKKIVYIPDWIRKLVIAKVRLFTPKRFYAKIEFFLTSMAEDMIAPKFGKHTLKDFFNSLHHDNFKK